MEIFQNVRSKMSVRKICFPYYFVKDGENLKIVAEKFGVDSTKILIDNKISPKEIKPGTILKIEN